MIISKYRQVLSEKELNIPGLVLFGHNISSKATFPMIAHTHEGCLEIVVVVKGNECYFVDGQRFELSGGDVFISYLGQPHGSGDSAQGVCEIIWFQINPSIEGNFLGLSKPFEDMIKKQLRTLDTHTLSIKSDSIILLKKSFKGFLQLDKYNRLYSLSLLISFLSKLLFMQKYFKEDNALIQFAIRYIDINIYNPITIEELSTVCHISLSGFKHKFKECMGETPRDYINHRKILKAKELLKNGNNITKTAMLLSFNSSDYFSVVFKKYTASTPTEYVINHLV